MPVTSYGISYWRFLLFHKQRHYLCLVAVRLRPAIDSYIRRFVSVMKLYILTHSNHRYFIDLRHIDYIACLQATFHNITCLGNSLPTLTSFRHLFYYTNIILSIKSVITPGTPPNAEHDTVHIFIGKVTPVKIPLTQTIVNAKSPKSAVISIVRNGRLPLNENIIKAIAHITPPI